MKKTKSTVRNVAVDLLVAVEKNQSYSNLLLHNAIEKNRIEGPDIGLLTELTYGTIQRRMTLDYYLTPFLKKANRLENWILQLLRMTVYQMVFLDRVPDHAAIHEAVEIAKLRGHKGVASLVNGVLRSVQREGIPSLEDIADPIERLSIETSHPIWLVKRWTSQFGLEKTREMCEINLVAPFQTARINTTLATINRVIDMLTDEGFYVQKSVVVPEAIKCLKGNLAYSKAFERGLITIQDESSMLVAYALNPQENELILDSCAAPGGKSTHIAEKMNGVGKVISLDLHEHKVKLIRENATRLQLENIETKAMDSRKVEEVFEKESMDRVLLDAPCSGLGVMRRKPDIKYTKSEQDITRLHDIQMQLLSSVAPLVKKGGTMVYSTCTVDKEENSLIVAEFLDKHPDWVMDDTLIERIPEAVKPFVQAHELQVFPQDFGSDGFYIASLKKKV